MADGWAGWDAPRAPRPRLEPVGAQQVRYCPRCTVETIFEPAAGELQIACLGCGYRAGDSLTDGQLLGLVDRFKLPLPAQDSRVVV